MPRMTIIAHSEKGKIIVDETNVSFSSDFLNKLEEIAFFRLVDATSSSEEQAKQTKSFVRAFTRRGVPMRTIIDAMLEIHNEQRKERDNI